MIDRLNEAEALQSVGTQTNPMDVELEKLSHREGEILRLASEGFTDKEIAGHLGVQISTVRTYWDRLKAKLSATNRTEAVARSLKLAPGEPVLSHIAGAIPHLLLVTDPNGKVEFANERALEYFGLNRVEGVAWSDLVHPDDGELLGLKEGIAIVRCRRRDGEYRRHVATQSPLEIRDGFVAKWIRSAVDIQELALRNVKTASENP